MTRTPQIIVTLSPNGDLVIELPGFMATRRKVEVTPDNLGAVALRILQAQQADLDSNRPTTIGFDGEPTAQQVAHWERHAIDEDPRCPFCIAEARQREQKQQKGIRHRTPIPISNSEVKVRRIAEGESGLGPKPSGKTSTEMGL